MQPYAIAGADFTSRWFAKNLQNFLQGLSHRSTVQAKKSNGRNG